MKNLVTDKPAPITVALAQTSTVARNLAKMEKSAWFNNNIESTLKRINYQYWKGLLKYYLRLIINISK